MSDPAIRALAERLMREFWPGPLTLVLPSADGATVGVRVPDHPVALALLHIFALHTQGSSNPLGGESREVATFSLPLYPYFLVKDLLGDYARNVHAKHLFGYSADPQRAAALAATGREQFAKHFAEATVLAQWREFLHKVQR